MTKLCQELFRDFHHKSWNEDDLALLPARELRFLCRMAGFYHTGTKEKLIVRLLSCRIVRLELARFGDDPYLVVPLFSRSRLRWMCEQANLWKSGTKVQLAAVLLKWRNTCRLEGQKYWQECLAHSKRAGMQLELSLNDPD